MPVGGGEITEILHIIVRGAENKKECHSVTVIAWCTHISSARVQFWSPHFKESIVESQKAQRRSPKIIKATEQIATKEEMVEGAMLDIHKIIVRVEKVNAVFLFTKSHNTGSRRR